MTFFIKWVDYDPSWLVSAAEAELTDDEDRPIIDALKKCTQAKIESDAYIYFVDARNANEEDSEWNFDRNVMLFNTEHGIIVIDILKGNKIGGIEFFDRV